MDNVWGRWASAAVLAIAGFVACWASLRFWDGLQAPVALGWAILPFSVLMTLGGVWADQVRKKRKRDSAQLDSSHVKKVRIVQNQYASDHAKQLQVGHDIKMVDKDE